MLSATRLIRWSVLLATVGSWTVAWAAEPGTEAPPADAAKAKEKEKPKDAPQEKDSGEAQDLAHTLQQGEVAPVSRVMGQRIVASAVKPYAHGTFVVDWRWGDGSLSLPNTLELRESHLYFGAHILDFAQPEVFIQVEKKNQTDVPLTLRYGQVDLRLHDDLAVIRVGLFLVPFGVYNTELFLRYDAKLPERPELHRRVIPGSWSEVGVEAWGRWQWSPGRFLSYAAYVTNGQSGNLTPARASYDPVYRSLTGAKSVGARIAVQPLDGLQVGLSGYRGVLNGVDGALALGGLDAVFRRGSFSMDGELIYGQRLDPTPIPEGGFYVAAGYKVTDAIEPVLGVGGTTTGPTSQENEMDIDVGLNVYPAADRFPTAVVKAAYQRDLEPGGGGGNGVTVAFAIGF